jgi:hypothetical protein
MQEAVVAIRPGFNGEKLWWPMECLRTAPKFLRRRSGIFLNESRFRSFAESPGSAPPW